MSLGSFHARVLGLCGPWLCRFLHGVLLLGCLPLGSVFSVTKKKSHGFRSLMAGDVAPCRVGGLGEGTETPGDLARATVCLAVAGPQRRGRLLHLRSRTLASWRLCARGHLGVPPLYLYLVPPVSLVLRALRGSLSVPKHLWTRTSSFVCVRPSTSSFCPCVCVAHTRPPFSSPGSGDKAR